MDLVDADALAGALSSPASAAALGPGPDGGALLIDLRAAPPGLDTSPLRTLTAVVVALVDAPPGGATATPGDPGDPVRPSGPVRLSSPGGPPDASGPDRPRASGGPAAQVVACASGPASGADLVVTTEEAAAAVASAVEGHPLAATALVILLRAGAGLGIDEALAAESATYSLLQPGPEHRAWLDARPPPRPRSDDGRRVRVERRGDELAITLARPDVRNAVDAAMQEALADALLTAGPDVARITLSGEGPSFSSGGDLAEFGRLRDPASAHLLRLARSPGRALARVAERTTAVVHGACYGAGVELPAFAGRVVARPGTTFTLPEVAMGLVPGAGGTVSLPRRIGAQRTAWLALTGETLDAPTALAWGLVDTVEDVVG